MILRYTKQNTIKQLVTIYEATYHIYRGMTSMTIPAAMKNSPSVFPTTSDITNGTCPEKALQKYGVVKGSEKKKYAGW